MKVLSALFLVVSLGLVACGDKRSATDKTTPAPAVGSKTTLGKSLSNGHWCSQDQVTEGGKVFVEIWELRTNGDFVRTIEVLRKDAQLEQEARTEGQWALLGSSLYILQDEKAIPYSVKMKDVAFEVDKTPCMDVESEDKVTSFCRCRIN